MCGYSLQWNFFPIPFSLTLSLRFDILCLFICIIFHLIILILVLFKWFPKSQMILYMCHFLLMNIFKPQAWKQQSSVCSNATQLGLSQFPGPLNWYLWKVLVEFAHRTFGLCPDPIGSKVALALRNWLKGPVTGYKLLDISHPNHFSLQHISTRRLGLVEL